MLSMTHALQADLLERSKSDPGNGIRDAEISRTPLFSERHPEEMGGLPKAGVSRLKHRLEFVASKSGIYVWALGGASGIRESGHM